MCWPSCGNLDSPPSRQNMSLIAIIQLVIMICVGIVCLVELVTVIQNGSSWTLIPILKVVVDGLIVIGLALVLIGLFCSPSQYQIRSGILCFCVGAILSIVVTILVLLKVDKHYNQTSTVGYNICYVIVLVIVSWILWRQSGHL